MSMERRMSFGQDRRTWRKKFKNDSNDNNESKSKETSRNQSRDQSMDLKDEEMPLESGDSSRLQIAVGAFQRKYRSMSVYGEHVIDIAERSKKALFIFPERNSIRMFCKRVVENKYPFLLLILIVFLFFLCYFMFKIQSREEISAAPKVSIWCLLPF